MAKKITIGNTLGFWFIDKDGTITTEKDGTPTVPVITVYTRKNKEGELDTIEVLFPDDVKVSGYSKTAGTGLQSAATQELLKTIWVKKGTLEDDYIEYLPDEDKFVVDCEFAADDKDVDPNATGKIIEGFREARKQHNNACPPDSSDDSKSKKSESDSEPDSEPDPKPEPVKKKRPARKSNESANGTELSHASRDQTDRDTHDTLVAMFGEDSDVAKYYNGLVWDDVAKVYKDA